MLKTRENDNEILKISFFKFLLKEMQFIILHLKLIRKELNILE